MGKKLFLNNFMIINKGFVNKDHSHHLIMFQKELALGISKMYSYFPPF